MTAQEQDYIDSVFMRFWDEGYLHYTLRVSESAVVVAELRKKIVGLAIALAEGGGHAARLSRLDALPDCRTGGLLSELLEGCEACLPHTIDYLKTCVPQGEEEQIGFYESHGYRRLRTFEVTNPACANRFVELAKPLNGAYCDV